MPAVMRKIEINPSIAEDDGWETILSREWIWLRIIK